MSDQVVTSDVGARKHCMFFSQTPDEQLGSDRVVQV
jgi:hypothetical protein